MEGDKNFLLFLWYKIVRNILNMYKDIKDKCEEKILLVGNSIFVI